MNWSWAASIEQLWRSPSFPMWAALAVAGFFGIVVLVALLRAEKSVANAALTIIALLAIGGAATVFLRNGPAESVAPREPVGRETASLNQPALACVDDLAGETVLAACEKLLFGSPDTVAAAVSYTSNRINRLLAAGDVAANKTVTPDLERLRRAIERDRYGLVAYVLASRDHCQPGECPAYASLTDHNQIAANMDERLYETQVMRYAASWGGAQPAPAAAAVAAPGAPPAVPPVAALAPTAPTGKPTNADFPTSSSIPPVNIMTPEPPAAAPAAKPANAVAAKPAAAASHAASSAAPSATANAQAQAATRPAATQPPKKPAAPPKPKPVAPAPVQLAPAPASAEE